MRCPVFKQVRTCCIIVSKASTGLESWLNRSSTLNSVSVAGKRKEARDDRVKKRLVRSSLQHTERWGD